MQNWTRLYDYIHEYQRLVYDRYSQNAVAYLVNYYNLNIGDTIWEDEDVLAGSYERIGELSGRRWTKILNLPVFYIEEMSTIFDGQDIGYVKEGETQFVIPSTYGITPYVGDVIKLEQAYLRPENDVYPIYMISGIEKSVNADKTFWRIKAKVYHSTTTTALDQQVTENRIFYDYDKRIHTLTDAEILTNTLILHRTLQDRLKSKWDSNSGFYFIEE